MCNVAQFTLNYALLQAKVKLHGYYGTAQRQFDTRSHAAGRILSGEDYIMFSISERAPVTFVPTSGNLSGICTHKHYIIVYEPLKNNEYYNINSICTIKLQILPLYVLINP